MPGVPNEDEITADLNKASGSSSTPSPASSLAYPPLISGSHSRPAPSSMQLTLRDKWEDIRDAVTDTQAFKIISKHAAGVNKITSALWTNVQRFAWIFGTSALVLVVPLLYEVDRELAAENSAANINSASAPTAPSSTDSSAPSSAPSSSSTAAPTAPAPSIGDASAVSTASSAS